MYIKEVDSVDAIEFIQKYHYSKILPRITKKYLGFFIENDLCGVVTLGWGTQPLQTIKKIFYNDNVTATDYLEIGKMCFDPRFNSTSSFGSIVISMLVKWMKLNTDCKFLYTLADVIMGKCGYVYQASNFIYIGKFKTSVYMNTKTGEKIHPRSAKTLLAENAIYDGVNKRFWLTDNFCKYKEIEKINGLMFRYIYPLNRDAKDILKRYEEYSGLKRPKDDDLVFEKRTSSGKYGTITQPNFNMNVFDYNYQKY